MADMLLVLRHSGSGALETPYLLTTCILYLVDAERICRLHLQNEYDFEGDRQKVDLAISTTILSQTSKGGECRGAVHSTGWL